MKSIIFAFVFLAGCASYKSNNTAKVRAEDRDKIKNELGNEVSLAADRSKLDELRKEIPEEKKKANDELALFLNMMKQGSEQPNLVREKFTVMVQKKRTEFRTKTQRLRDDFRKDETKLREEFLNKQKADREAFTKKKHDSKENREFFSEQDKLRQRYFADERDRRQSFESELSAQTKDFESYMRERTNEFNEQFRLYSMKQAEKPKEKKAVTGESGFDKLKKADGEPLGTDN